MNHAVRHPRRQSNVPDEGSGSDRVAGPRRRIRWVALIVVGALVAAACGNDDDGEAEATDEGEAEATDEGEAQIETPTMAWTAPTQPTFVNRDYGIVERGPEFGLDATTDDFVTFESHATAAQAVLSGNADIVGGSFVSTLLLNQEGQDFRSFCPFIENDDFVLVARSGITEMSQLFDSDVAVAIDSPGGAGDIILNAMLQAAGEERPASELPGAQILESSGLRTTAFASGDVDVSLVHLTQLNADIAPVVPDTEILSRMWEDIPIFLKETLAAPADWIDANLDTATAVCASVIAGSRDLAEDDQAFADAVETYVEEPPGQEELDDIFPLLTDDFWPLETGLTEEAVTFMSEVAVASGVLEEVPAYDDVVDLRPFEMALERVG